MMVKAIRVLALPVIEAETTWLALRRLGLQPGFDDFAILAAFSLSPIALALGLARKRGGGVGGKSPHEDQDPQSAGEDRKTVG